MKGATLSGLLLGKWKLCPFIRQLTWTLEPARYKVIKCIKSTSAMGELFHTWEGLWRGIDALCCHLKSYDVESWLIICEQETCKASVRQLEAALVAEVLTDEEEELVCERARDEAKRQLVVCQRGRVEEMEEENEEDEEDEGDEDEEDKLDHSSRLSAKVRGKCPTK